MSETPFEGEIVYNLNLGNYTSTSDKSYTSNSQLIYNRLQGSLDVICYSHEHITILLSLALPLIIIILFGMPMFALFHIYRSKKKIEESDLADNNVKENALSSVYGFLFEGVSLFVFLFLYVFSYYFLHYYCNIVQKEIFLLGIIVILFLRILILCFLLFIIFILLFLFLFFVLFM